MYKFRLIIKYIAIALWIIALLFVVIIKERVWEYYKEDVKDIYPEKTYHKIKGTKHETAK